MNWFYGIAIAALAAGVAAWVLARRVLARAKEAERRFRLAVDAVSGVIYEYDFATRKVDRTRGLYEMLGYAPEEVPPEPDWWNAQVHPDDQPKRLSDFYDGAARGQNNFVLHYRMRHKDGRWLHVEDRALLVRDEHGQPARLCGCTVDVTDRMHAERELRRLNAELREADRHKDEFVATLAHELRNPLAPIRNAVRILKMKLPPRPELAWGTDVIERQVDHMAHLLEDLLDVSRIARGKFELRRLRVPLKAVIDSALEASRPLIEVSGHRLEVRLPPEPLELDADPVRLAQVFGNLLNNAAKYTERAGRIELDAVREDGSVRVAVRDNGIGIEPEMHGRLFRMFSQAAPALERAQGGLGVGLSLAKGLVELHGGRVEAHSDGPGRGSEFVVYLPLAPALPEPAEAADAPDDGGAQLPRRILVVDDNRDSADTLASLLQVMGSDVHAVYGGEDALREAEMFRPQAVLLDLGMPQVSGFEVCERLRREEWGRGMFVVAVTGWGQEDDRRRTAAAGFDAHLVKPADPAALVKLLATRA